MTFRTGATLAAALSLGACGQGATTDPSQAAPAGTAPAEAACLAAVGANTGGGRASILSSQSSDPGSLVVLRSGNGTNWSCRTAGTGVVVELSVV